MKISRTWLGVLGFVSGGILLASFVGGCGSDNSDSQTSVAASQAVGLKTDQPWVGEPLESSVFKEVGAELADYQVSETGNRYRSKRCFSYENPKAPNLEVICDLVPRFGATERCLTTGPTSTGRIEKFKCRSHPDRGTWVKACLAENPRGICEEFAIRGTGTCSDIGPQPREQKGKGPFPLAAKVQPRGKVCTGVGLPTERKVERALRNAV